jgi:uncharacterized YigZ family protein
MGNLKFIRRPAQAELVEKKSRFIANIFPVETEEEALSYIEAIKKKNYDARHNCYAYIVGPADEFVHCSDDGEPAHTAGRPMLDILKKSDIHNVCVVVTRYFGGILLGTGGLVRAYGDAVKLAIEECEIYELARYVPINVRTDYSSHGKISNWAANQGFVITKLVYTENVEFDLCVTPECVEEALKMITNITNGSAVTSVGEELLM